MEVGADEVMARTGIEAGELDLLAGGPPCQGFSVQRQGADVDPRNRMVLEFVRFAEVLRPRTLLMENVGGLLARRGRLVMTELTARLATAGYRLSIHKLDAVRFGVPQFRVRVFMIGEREDAFSLAFWPPAPLRTPETYATVRDAIGDLPSPPADGRSHPDFANHYREAGLSSLNLERLRHIPEGGGRADLPLRLQLPGHLNNPDHRHLDVYGRLAWDRPSGTLTARFDSFTRGRFGHPVENRSITLREGARLQAFPDDFVFDGNREEGARQIGNAVPPLVAEVIGRSLLTRGGDGGEAGGDPVQLPLAAPVEVGAR